MSLVLEGLSLRLGGHPVLDGVSLDVRRGDCYGLLGHNGAGKTTAMRIALGLTRADAGRVVVDGFDAARHPREARARMGALIESPGFHAALSGRENLRLLARLRGLGRAEASAEADRRLAEVGLAHAASKAAGAYSQGMRQRLGIAQALLGGPRIVLLDEPSNGLDPEGIGEIRALLRRLTREEGITVLLSSHQLHEIADVCTRIGILRSGRRVLEDTTANLLGGHADRSVLHTTDDAAAARILAERGIQAAPRALGGLTVSVRPGTSAGLVRELVLAGVGVESVAPETVTLEEIYLRTTHAPAASAPADGPTPADAPRDAAPAERLAPKGPAWLVARYEVRRWTARPSAALLPALPALLAVLAVRARASEVDADRARVAAGNLASATGATAFEAVAVGLRVGLPALAVVLCGVAALSVSGELAGGTLRNVVLRPVGRARVVLGKALALAAATALGAALLVGTTCLAAAQWFDFADLNELLITGDLFPLQPADAVWPDLHRALWTPLAGLGAYAAIGLLVGTVCRSGAAAVGTAVAACGALALAPAFLPEASLPSAYLPMLRDVSQVQRLLDTARNVSNAAEVHAGGALWIPAVWAAAAVGTACAILRRRWIP